MKTSMRFRDLQIGQTFDFIKPDCPTYNSFFHTCKKISNRKYVAIHPDGVVNLRYGQMRVGTINVEVYNVA